MAYWGRKDKLHSMFRLDGIEHMEAAKAAGKGIIIVGGHITSLELLLRLFCESWPSAALYKPNQNALFEWYSVRKRARYTLPISNHKLRSFLKHLKKGGTSIYLSDQDYGRRDSVFAPFFGVQASTIKHPPDYVKLTGALLMPVIFGRNPDGKGYYAEVMPPLENYPSGDEVQDATRLNYWIEQNILRHPEQYLWQHRRFKHRPPGQPPIY
jgi:KDO2-lipid IV(A) lauroyltransferase